MTDATPTSTGQPAADGSPSAAGGPSSAAPDATVQERAAALAYERPEVAAGAAFAGGVVLALILKRLAR